MNNNIKIKVLYYINMYAYSAVIFYMLFIYLSDIFR